MEILGVGKDERLQRTLKHPNVTCFWLLISLINYSLKHNYLD